MRRLLLLRHAKSDWGHPGLNDFDRPLNERGTNAAKRMGEWIKQQAIQPEWVVCSPAQRTRETLQHLQNALSIPQALIHFEQQAYLACIDDLLNILAQCPEDFSQVMLIGHNPGMEELFSYLCGSNLPLSTSGELMSTATLAQIEMPNNWHQLHAQPGKLIAITRPTEIT